MNSDKRRTIDSSLEWIQNIVRNTTQRFIKMAIQKKNIQANKLEQDQSIVSEQNWQMETTTLNEKILPTLERYLNSKDYVTGYEYTIADIAIYNELQNIFAFAGEPESDKFKNVNKWMK